MKTTILSSLCVAGSLCLGLAAPALAQTTGSGTMGSTGMSMGQAGAHTAGKYGPGTTGLSSNGAGMHKTGMGLTPPGVSGTDPVGAGPNSPPTTIGTALPSTGTGAHNPATARPLATTGGVPR